jgi:hypothetical protein
VDTSDRLCSASPSNATDPVTSATANSTPPVAARPSAESAIARRTKARSAASSWPGASRSPTRPQVVREPRILTAEDRLQIGKHTLRSSAKAPTGNAGPAGCRLSSSDGQPDGRDRPSRRLRGWGG